MRFINQNRYGISLLDENQKPVHIKGNSEIELSEYFLKYSPRYLTTIRQTPKPAITSKTIMRGPIKPNIIPPKRNNQVRTISGNRVTYSQKPLVGKTNNNSSAATKKLHELIQNTSMPISNDIGVGILSYNRLNCIQRLINSIRAHTNLSKTTIFISDESTDQKVHQYLDTITDMVVIKNNERIGVAGNTNRLMRCLQRFKYKILLNDDTEILNNDWENFFIERLNKTGLHHVLVNQPGIYNHELHQTTSKHNDITIQTLCERPQGAALIYDNKAFQTVGYFDESFGLYGMEHVDWSNRISLSGIQINGFHSFENSSNYIKIYKEESAVGNRSDLLKETRCLYDNHKNNKNRVYINPTDKSKVESISCIIPFRGNDRIKSIKTVIQNIKANRYPQIDIYAVEQNHKTEISLSEFETINYVLASTPENQGFTKSIALNVGVSKSKNNKIILHDADMLVQHDYFKIMSKLLDQYEGVHIGKGVTYLSKESTELLNNTHLFSNNLNSERSVSYYEGGSLGCLLSAYIKIGGFNEDFISYGCEDCDFFARLVSTKFFNERTIDLIHLWHDRTPGWNDCHNKNKVILTNLEKLSIEERIKRIKLTFDNKYKT